MITIVTSRGTLQYPPGCKLDKQSIVNYVSHLLGMESEFFVLSYKDKQEDVIALDTEQDFEGLRTLRKAGLDHVQITVQSVSDTKLPAEDETTNTDAIKTESPSKPVQAPATTPAETKPQLTPEQKAAAEAKKLERQKQKQLEKEKAQEELKKKREEKQKEARELKEQRQKEKEAILKARKEAKEAKEEELKKKEAKKEAKKEKEDDKQHKSLEKKNTDAKEPAEKAPIKQAYIETNPFKQLTICTGCEQSPIGAPFFRCITCQRFTICLNCQSKWSHQHPLLKIRRENELPLLIISVTREQVPATPDEQEFVANLKNVAVEKLKLAHKHKVKLIKDDKLHIKQQEKEKEREAAKVQKEKERALLKEKQKEDKAEKVAEKVAAKGKKEEKKEEEAPISYPSIA